MRTSKTPGKKTGAPGELARVLLFLVACALGFWVFFITLTKILRYMPEPIGSRAELFSSGAQQTLLLTLAAGIFGLIAGVLAGLGKLSKRAWIRTPTDFYVWIMRGTPLLVQILFVYYAVPSILQGLVTSLGAVFPNYVSVESLMPWTRLGEFGAACLALALNVGAYNAEVIRAGVLAVPRGQREAAESLGLSGTQTMRWVILPQAIRIVIPPLVNNIVALLKDSSLASTIGLLELSLAGNRISSETFLPVPVLTTVACIYLALTTALSIITTFLEKRLAVGRRN